MKFSLSDLTQASEHLHLQIPDDEAAAYLEYLDSCLEAYRLVDDYSVTSRSRPKYARDGGWKPTDDDNQHGAWAWRTSIKGADEGLLVGRTFAVKDSISVSGVPMLVGSALMEGYEPDVDATVVERVLDAGATLLGKATCENFCFSAGSHTSNTGPVLNPAAPGFSVGGSSSGCAALVAAGDVDLAIGGDNGGSVRIPSSWAGIVGLKPTYGLVPYTGAVPVDITFDHLGPMGRSVRDVALMMQAMMGPDDLDPRHRSAVGWRPFSDADVRSAARGLRVGVLTEGFGLPGISSESVDSAVRCAVERVRDHKADVAEVSVGLHRLGSSLHTVILAESAMLRGTGVGTGWQGWYDVPLIERLAPILRENRNRLPRLMKAFMLLGEHMSLAHNGAYYARAQNLVPALTAAYDQALQEVDVLALPTTPYGALPMPAPCPTTSEELQFAPGININAAPMNLTGHPALTIPCDRLDGLPVGVMLVGRRGEDLTVLQAGLAFEETSNLFV